MALTQCRECGKEVSTEALTCPHCGVPRPTAPSPPASPSPGVVGSPFRKAPPSSQLQERKPPQTAGAVIPASQPGVQSASKALQTRKSRRKSRWPWVLLGVLLMFLGFSVWEQIAGPEEITTVTGIKTTSECPASVRSHLDDLNRLGGQAKIYSAVCSKAGGLYWAGLQAVDGRMMEWKRDEGTDELAKRLYFGR